MQRGAKAQANNLPHDIFLKKNAFPRGKALSPNIDSLTHSKPGLRSENEHETLNNGRFCMKQSIQMRYLVV
jgi:hypothetical protein